MYHSSSTAKQNVTSLPPGKFFYVVIGFLLFLVSGCTKGWGSWDLLSGPWTGPIINYEYRPFPLTNDYTKFASAAVDYVQHKQGALHIFKDSASGALDTVSVDEFVFEKRKRPAFDFYAGTDTTIKKPIMYKVPETYFDTLVLTMNLINNGTKTSWLHATANLPEFKADKTVDSSLYLNPVTDLNYRDYSRKVFKYNAAPGVNTFDTVTIENVFYSNIIRTEMQIGAGAGGELHIFWWAPNKGIIKRSVSKVGAPAKVSLLVKII